MFKKGDKVRINRCSQYHDRSNTNPSHRVTGTVISVRDFGGLPITVQWHGGVNTYSHRDLVKVET